MNKEELKKKALGLPMKSGVYIMKNINSNIIYIGKAKKLRNRVKQYFDGSKKQIKVQAMVDNVFDFDYVLTSSDADAFLLENNLIKQHKPKYNILLKDDKQYPYIKINLKEKYPQVVVTRKVIADDALYFGPYVNMRVGELIEVIRSAFKVRTCSINFEKRNKKLKPCLHGQINKCLAPCLNELDDSVYDSVIKNVIDFLRGDTDEALRILNEKMQICAQNEDFENAIKLRDEIKLLENLGEKHFASLTKDESFDVFAIVCDEDLYVINVCNIKKGRNVGQVNYIVAEYGDDCAEILGEFICDYYQSASLVSKNILTNVVVDNSVIQFLKEKYNKNVEINFPQRGVKKEIINLAEANAKEYKFKIVQKNEYRQNLTVNALLELQNILGVDYINRIEGFDISNIQGNYNVSSMVVFVGGEPAKNEYRKFKIKTFEGANDFASMAETIKRRFERFKNGDENFSSLPDLILIDGGLGQLHYANNVLEEMGIVKPIISLAEKNEEIYTIYSSEPIVLEKRNYALRLLQRVRDESHRFAITFHRKTRNKEFLSEFEKIDGVGKITRQKILSKYKNVDDLYEASVIELKQELGIGFQTAQRIYKYLHKTQNVAQEQ